MSLADLLDLVLPLTCGGCGAPGSAWCPACAAGPWPIRHVVLRDAPPVVVAGPYSGPLRSGLLAYKERGRRDLGGPFSALLADVVLAGLPSVVAAPGRPPLCLVPAPSRPAATRSRGGDHVLRLGQALAGALRWRGQPCVVSPVLRMRRGVRDSVGLDPAAREANLRGRVQVRDRAALPAGPVVLLDDVVTTGATIRAATDALGRAGVVTGAALVLCDASGPPAGRVGYSSVGPTVWPPVERAGQIRVVRGRPHGDTFRSGLLPERDPSYRASQHLGGNGEEANGQV